MGIEGAVKLGYRDGARGDRGPEERLEILRGQWLRGL
mgnify:CR=1 FL=1